MVTLMSRDAEEAIAAFPPARWGNPDLHRTTPFVDRPDVEALDEEVLARSEIVHGEVQRLAAETAVPEERRHDAEGGMDPGLVPRHLARGGQGRSVTDDPSSASRHPWRTTRKEWPAGRAWVRRVRTG